VGYLACRREIAEQITDLKLLTGLTTSEIGERVVHELLTDGHYRKHLDRLRGRLQCAREEAMRNLERLGFRIYLEPEGGMFVWAGVEDRMNVVEMTRAAAERGIMLAPGNLFRPHQEPAPWLRINVASCGDDANLAFLTEFVNRYR
jgi:DNA-binding transcriptional MocR family regulator